MSIQFASIPLVDGWVQETYMEVCIMRREKLDAVSVIGKDGLTPRGHDIYFDASSINGGCLSMKCNDIRLAKTKATAWLNWEVCQDEPIKGYWEKTDYLTYFWRAEPRWG
tara:strand:+ start:331 stop:660 length:330 start_codon:yes stop_codon:yes gene_type:complete